MTQREHMEPIKEQGDLIVAEYSGPLSQHFHGFIYLDERLEASRLKFLH